MSPPNPPTRRLAARKRLKELQGIYASIKTWSPDRKQAERELTAINPSAFLAVVGEAVGPRTLRLSGVPYFDDRGQIGRAGKYLDDILKSVGYTVYPPQDIRVRHGTIHRSPGLGRYTAYYTDMCPTFPGYQRDSNGRMRIRRPSSGLIRSAMERGFLEAELELIDPKVILLLGGQTYKYFYRYLLGKPKIPKLARVVESQQVMEFPRYRSSLVFPFFHPSPASPRFLRWYGEFGPHLLSCPLLKSLAECLKKRDCYLGPTIP